MKVITLSVYEAVPLYEMFEGYFYTHIDDIAYFFVPDSIYKHYAKELPRHLLNDYPVNLKTLSNEIINN